MERSLLDTWNDALSAQVADRDVRLRRCRFARWWPEIRPDLSVFASIYQSEGAATMALKIIGSASAGRGRVHLLESWASPLPPHGRARWRDPEQPPFWNAPRPASPSTGTRAQYDAQVDFPGAAVWPIWSRLPAAKVIHTERPRRSGGPATDHRTVLAPLRERCPRTSGIATFRTLDMLFARWLVRLSTGETCIRPTDRNNALFGKRAPPKSCRLHALEDPLCQRRRSRVPDGDFAEHCPRRVLGRSLGANPDRA